MKYLLIVIEEGKLSKHCFSTMNLADKNIECRHNRPPHADGAFVITVVIMLVKATPASITTDLKVNNSLNINAYMSCTSSPREYSWVAVGSSASSDSEPRAPSFFHSNRCLYHPQHGGSEVHNPTKNGQSMGSSITRVYRGVLEWHA